MNSLKNHKKLIKKSHHGFEHERVIFCSDKETRLRAIIAIHNTTLGPSLGGVRMVDYQSEEEALDDVLKLSEGMTYKAAFANLNLGGGKAVIIGNPKKAKSEALFRKFGEFVESLDGVYITAQDAGVDAKDIAYVSKETSYVTGTSESLGGCGDPSFYTAYGVLSGMKACVKYKLNKDSLKSVSVAIQGLGHVGSLLVKLLLDEGARVIVTDKDSSIMRSISQKFSVEYVLPEKILSVDCDIFSPCALGGVLKYKNVDQIQCKMIVGCANNQLKDQGVENILHKKGILYAPDFIVNAGGLIGVALEKEGNFLKKQAFEKISKIYSSFLDVLKKSENENISPSEFAKNLIEEKIRSNALLQNEKNKTLNKTSS